jgi:hypothetical protein
MDLYRLTKTSEDDSTVVTQDLTIDQVLQVVLNDTAQEDVVWYKVERTEAE